MTAPRLLLGSGGLSTEPRRQAWRDALREFLPASVERIVFVPFALAQHDAYLERIVQLDFAAGRQLEGLHRAADARAAIAQASAVYVGGGNTFRLLDRLQRLGLLGLLRERVAGGMPYVGISAGTNVACPTIRTTNDMPIVQPVSLDALGLVPFQVNPHWFDGPTYVHEDGAYRPYGGETRDDRLCEFLEENERPVLAIAEGGILRVEGPCARLLAAPARLFRRGRDPEDLAAGSDLSSLLVA